MLGGQWIGHFGLHGMHIMAARSGQITHVGGQPRPLWHEGFGHPFGGCFRSVTKQGHIEASGVVVLGVKAPRQPKCGLKFGFHRRGMMGLCLFVCHFGAVVVQQGPCGQTFPQMQASKPFGWNRHGLHPWALAERFRDDRFVFDRVEGTRGDDHVPTGSHQTGRATRDVHLQAVHVPARRRLPRPPHFAVLPHGR